jgi:hypothetical protein
MSKRAAEIGIVMGIALVIMGFAYGNSGVWILANAKRALARAPWRRAGAAGIVHPHDRRGCLKLAA